VKSVSYTPLCLCRFYETTLGTPTRVCAQGSKGSPGAMEAEVCMGHPGTKLVFQEKNELGGTFSEEVGQV